MSDRAKRTRRSSGIKWGSTSLLALGASLSRPGVGRGCGWVFHIGLTVRYTIRSAGNGPFTDARESVKGGPADVRRPAYALLSALGRSPCI